ncbi:MAG: bifunctional precorrin-2 dehydrogenase/sirohydrochlorin ferrochelatase [Dissulfuribacterales bacterium]
MNFYPIYLNIKNRKCLVVGGGAVAARKAETLAKCGAIVMVVSQDFTESLHEIEKRSAVTLICRPYESSDLDGKFLVIGATNNEELNRNISADAEKRNMLCNIADVPDICNFILPSIICRGDFSIAISTSGKSPAFAKKLRKDFEKTFGEEYARFLTLMGAVRNKLLAEKHAPEAHKPLFEKLINSGLIDLIKNNRTKDINRLLDEILGSGYDYETLME